MQLGVIGRRQPVHRDDVAGLCAIVEHKDRLSAVELPADHGDILLEGLSGVTGVGAVTGDELLNQSGQGLWAQLAMRYPQHFRVTINCWFSIFNFDLFC